MSRDEDSLISEGRRKEREIKSKTVDAKAFTHHLPQADQCPDSLLETASPHPFPFCCWHDVIRYGISQYPFFGQFGSASPAVSPPNFFPIPSLSAGRAE